MRVVRNKVLLQWVARFGALLISPVSFFWLILFGWHAVLLLHPVFAITIRNISVLQSMSYSVHIHTSHMCECIMKRHTRQNILPFGFSDAFSRLIYALISLSFPTKVICSHCQANTLHSLLLSSFSKKKLELCEVLKFYNVAILKLLLICLSRCIQYLSVKSFEKRKLCSNENCITFHMRAIYCRYRCSCAIACCNLFNSRTKLKLHGYYYLINYLVQHY